MRRTWLIGVTGCLLALTACSSVAHQSGEAAPAGGASAGPSVSSPTSPATSASAKQPAVNGTPVSGSSGAAGHSEKPKTSTQLVPMQTSHGGEFASPSGNITCEIDYQQAGLTQAYCQTGSPARSVTMKANGTYQTCTGDQCLGNSGEGTPTLAYGKVTGVGPFRCESATIGITCTANGKGFRIANSGVTPATA